jgi:hypothetical protein
MCKTAFYGFHLCFENLPEMFQGKTGWEKQIF